MKVTFLITRNYLYLYSAGRTKNTMRIVLFCKEPFSSHLIKSTSDLMRGREGGVKKNTYNFSLLSSSSVIFNPECYKNVNSGGKPVAAPFIAPFVMKNAGKIKNLVLGGCWKVFHISYSA